MILSKRVNAEKLESIADMIRVIAHPQRLDIVVLLQDLGRLTMNQIANFLELDQAKTSEYLSLLKDKGVLRTEKKGHLQYFILVSGNMKKITKCLEVCCKGGN